MKASLITSAVLALAGVVSAAAVPDQSNKHYEAQHYDGKNDYNDKGQHYNNDDYNKKKQHDDDYRKKQQEEENKKKQVDHKDNNNYDNGYKHDNDDYDRKKKDTDDYQKKQQKEDDDRKKYEDKHTHDDNKYNDRKGYGDKKNVEHKPEPQHKPAPVEHKPTPEHEPASVEHKPAPVHKPAPDHKPEHKPEHKPIPEHKPASEHKSAPVEHKPAPVHKPAPEHKPAPVEHKSAPVEHKPASIPVVEHKATYDDKENDCSDDDKYAKPGYWSKYGYHEFTSHYYVKATPDQVINGTVVTPGEKGARGHYNFAINSKLDVICYKIVLTGVTGPYQSPAITATHIHEAKKGASGPPRIAFKNPGPETDDKIRRSEGCIKGPFVTGVKVPPMTGPDTGLGFKVAQIEANPSGFFADAHTRKFVPGVVRGQLGEEKKQYKKF